MAEKWPDLGARMQEYENETEFAKAMPLGDQALGSVQVFDTGEEYAVALSIDGMDPAAFGRMLIDIGQRILEGEQTRRSVQN